MSFALPVDRLSETSTLFAFYHPRPAYPLHILLVPKKPLATLPAPALHPTQDGVPQVQVSALDPKADGDFLTDLYATAQTLVEQFHLAESGYRLIARARGGKYQDFPYLHFHLISDLEP